MIIGTMENCGLCRQVKCECPRQIGKVKDPLSKKQQIEEAVNDLRNAMLANLEAEEKLIEVN